MPALPFLSSPRVCPYRHGSGLSVDAEIVARRRTPSLPAIRTARGAAYGVKSIAMHGSVPRLVDDGFIVAHRSQHANQTAPQNLHRYGSPPCQYAMALRGCPKKTATEVAVFPLVLPGGLAHRVTAESDRRDTRELIPSTLR
ncbi:hypothetical protein [Pandoraea morbifera]|uniref:hypothetical protein n=1 Tax=Pandoraea morbifera TaxID=2508300 RepID=UPI0012428CBF|nr:hypothetical protein [Pandoraea morbifera]